MKAIDRGSLIIKPGQFLVGCSCPAPLVLPDFFAGLDAELVCRVRHEEPYRGITSYEVLTDADLSDDDRTSYVSLVKADHGYNKDNWTVPFYEFGFRIGPLFLPLAGGAG
jgi:hypothetical protein